jgi:hypothetical protein
VFNQQYTKEEYEILVPKIMEHMRKTKEWGEFFPTTTSTFAYNETIAQRYYPLTKEEVLAQGWLWLDEIEKKDRKVIAAVEIADSIDDVTDDICTKILQCHSSGKPYKIIPQELKLYRLLHVPLPRQCFFERNKKRHDQRNPRVMYDRTCAKCDVAIRTTYAPSRLEIVYCEKCYVETVC